MTERWRQVGQELGIDIPERVGRLAMPLFDREQEGEPNEEGKRKRMLVAARATTRRDRVIVETHGPRPTVEIPGTFKPRDCAVVEFTKTMFMAMDPPTGAGAGAGIPPVGGMEETMFARALGDFAPFVEEQGVDLFHPANAAVATEALRTDFAGHHFSFAIRMATAGELGLRLS